MIISALNYNEFYLDQILVSMESMKTNSPNDRMTIYLVDFPNDVIETLEERYPNYNFILEDVTLKGMSNEAVRGYMVCYRAEVVLRQLQEQKSPVAWFDADLIIRKDLSKFWEDIGSNTLKVMVRENAPEKNRFQAGIFGIGYSQESIDYITDWRNIIRKGNRWFLDQLELYRVYEKHKNNISLLSMSKDFNDIGGREDSFSDDSYIWHSKSSHMDNPKFRKEWSKYYDNSTK